MRERSPWLLALRAWSWVLRVEWQRRRVPFDVLVARLESTAPHRRHASGAHGAGAVVRVAAAGAPQAAVGRTAIAAAAVAAVRRAYDRSPFRTSCLGISLASLGLLRSLGVPARLAMGVKGPAAPVDAHAWLEIDGVSLDPGSAGYTPLRRPRAV